MERCWVHFFSIWVVDKCVRTVRSDHIIGNRRLIGGVGFFFLSRTHEKTEVQKSPSYLDLFRKKEILLYLFPWAMFTLINFAETPILDKTVFGQEFFALPATCRVCFHRSICGHRWNYCRYNGKKKSDHCGLYYAWHRVCNHFSLFHNYNHIILVFGS